jgi:multidrug efflux pump subunit AcrB
VNVRTSYVGANADIIEQQITEPLEKVINGVQGVKNITHPVSREQVPLQLNLN